MSYLSEHGTRAAVPQSEKLRADQVENSAGGQVWAVDKWTRLRRFLILGSEGGSYYANERDLTRENVAAVRECIAEDGARVVQEIVDVSVGGRAPRNDQAIFALAATVALGDEATKQAALAALPQVCRIGTHLFMFIEFLDSSFGKATGRAKRRAFAKWYANPRARDGQEIEGEDAVQRHTDWVALQVIKYRQRNGWTHRDVLRLAHPGGRSQGAAVEVPTSVRDVLTWAAGKKVEGDLPKIINGFEKAQAATSAAEVANLIGEYRLPREAIPTEFLKDAVVWDALLDGMPMTAMIRNLGNMTRAGVLTPTSDGTDKVVAALADGDVIRKARVHPFNVLVALKTYASGAGFRGSNTWSPVAQIVDALDGAFYLAFGNVVPTGKRWLFGLDVSGSMSTPMMDTNLSAREGAAAMALITASVESKFECVAFASGGTFTSRTSRYGGSDGLVPFPISKRQRLDDVVAKTERMQFGGTDCALPMLYAQKMEREVDVFAIYTDSETWAGGVHPTQALQDYRRASGIDAKLVVVGLTSNGFTIADPQDAGMMDVVGFDTASPNIISEFASGNL